MADPLNSTHSYLPDFVTRFLGPESPVVSTKSDTPSHSIVATPNPKAQVELQNIATHPENLKKLGIDTQARIAIQGEPQKQEAWGEMCRSMQKLWGQLERGPDKQVLNNTSNIQKSIQFLKTQQFALLAPELQKEFLGKVLLPGNDQILSGIQTMPVHERLHLAIRLQTPVYARQLLAEGKPHEASREFERAILFNPENKALHLEMAKALRRASDQDNNIQVKSLFDAQAIDSLNIYLADQPSNEEALKLKSEILLHQAQNTKILADQETNPGIKQKLYLDTLHSLQNSLQLSSKDFNKQHAQEVLELFRQTKSSLGAICQDVHSTKILIQIAKQLRNIPFKHQDLEFIDKSLMEDLGNLGNFYKLLFQNQKNTPEQFQAYTDLLKEYLDLRTEMVRPLQQASSVINKEELGQKIKEAQQSLLEQSTQLKHKNSREHLSQLLDRIVNHQDEDLYPLLNSAGIDKYVKACADNEQKLEQAQKISDPKVKRSTFLEVLGQYISLHHEKGANHVIDQLIGSVEQGSDLEKIQVYLALNTALQGSTFSKTESLKEQGRNIADRLLAHPSSDIPIKVQSLVLAKNYYEAFPDAALPGFTKDLGKIGLIEKELRNIQNDYLQQLTAANQDSRKLSEVQYFESLSLSMQIDQALLKDDAAHAIKDEDFRENFGAAALSRLGLYREVLAKHPDTDPEKRLELFGQLTSLAASYTPLSQGNEPLMSGIALIPTQTLIEKDVNVFFQDLLKQNPDASPLQKQVADSITMDLQFKLHRAIEEGNPHWPANLNAGSLKQFVDYAQNAHLLFAEAQSLQGPEAIKRYQQSSGLFLQLGLTNRISEAMDPVIKMAEQNSDPAQKVELLFSVASFFQQSHLKDKASAIFLKIEALENTSPELKEIITFTRGMRHLNEGRLDEAKQYFKTIPHHPQAKALLENIENGQKQHRVQLQLQVMRIVISSYYHGKPQADQIEKSLNEITKLVLSGKCSVYEAARHHLFGFMVETGPGWTLNGYLGSASEMSDQKFAESTYHLAGLLLKDDRTQAAGQIAQLLSEDPYVGKKATQFIDEEIPAKAKMDNIFNAGHGLLYLTPLAPVVAFVDVSSPSTIGEEGSEAHTINAVKGSLFNAATALIPFGIARWARVGAEAAFVARAGTLIESPLALKLGGFFVGTGTEAGAFTLSNMTLHSLMTGDASNWSLKNFGKEFGSMMVTFVLLHGVNLGVQRGGRALEKVSWLKATPEEAAKLQEAGKLRLSSEGQQLFRGASWGLRVSSFTGSEYLNEALGLREHDNSPLWMKLLSSAVTDAQMIRAGKAIDVISGGKISRIERNTHLQYKAHEFIPTLKKMGFEIDAGKIMRAERVGEPSAGELMLQNLVQSSLREGSVQTPSHETITKIQEIISKKMGLELSSQEGQRELALLIHYSMRAGEGGKPLEATELERNFYALEVTSLKILSDSGLNTNSPLGHKAKVSLMNLALSRHLSPERLGEFVQHSADLKDRLNHIVNDVLGAQAAKTPEGQELLANLLIFSIREAKSPSEISEPLVKWTDTGSDAKDALRLIVSNLTGKPAGTTSEGRKIMGELIFKLIRGSENSQDILKITQRLSDAEHDLTSLQLFKLSDMQTPEKKLALLYWVMSHGVSRNNLQRIAEKIKSGELHFEYAEGSVKLSQGEQVYELSEGDIIHTVEAHELIPDSPSAKPEAKKPIYRAVPPPFSKEMLALRKEAEHLAQSNTPFAKIAQDFLSGKISPQQYAQGKNNLGQQMLTEHLPAFTNVMIFLESLKKDPSLNLSKEHPPTGRTKDPSDIAPKLARRSFNDTAPLTDIAGARIVVRSNADAEAVIAKIQQRYKIREAYTKEGEIEAQPMSAEQMKERGISEKENVIWLDAKLDQDGIHRLVEGHPGSGYRALHIVVEADGKPVEIQIKTEAMHEWGEIEHKLVYKNSNLPENILEPIKQFRKSAADFLSKAEHLRPGDKLGEMPKAPEIPDTLPNAGEIKSLLQQMTTLMEKYSLQARSSETQNIEESPKAAESGRYPLLDKIEIGRYSPTEIRELRGRAELLEENIRSSQDSGSQSYWLRSAITFSGRGADPLTSQAASLALHAKDKIPVLLEIIRSKEKEFSATQDPQKQKQILDSLNDLYRDLEQHSKNLDRWLTANQQVNERAKEIIQFAFPYHRDEFRRILRSNIKGPFEDMAPEAPKAPIQFFLDAPHWGDNSQLTAHLLENALGGRDRSDQFVLHFYVQNASDRQSLIDYISHNTETTGYKISKHGAHGLEVRSPKGKYFYIEVKLQSEKVEIVDSPELLQVAARTGSEPLQHIQGPPESPPSDLIGVQDALSRQSEGGVTRNLRVAPASSRELPETIRPGKLSGILAIFGFGAAMLYGPDAHAAVHNVASSVHPHSDFIFEGLKYAATIIPVIGMFSFGKEGQTKITPSLEVKPELQETVIHLGRAYGHFTDDNSVSGKHAVLYKNAAGVWCIQDGSIVDGVLKPSKNGIKILTLDGHSNIIKEKILPSGGNHTLLDGQIIVLGNSSFIFRAPENPPNAVKPKNPNPQSAARSNPPPLPKPISPPGSPIDFSKYPSLVIPATSHPRDEFIVANNTYEAEGQKAHHIVNDGNDPLARVYFSIRQTGSGDWYVYDGRIGRAEKSPFGIDVILPNGQRKKVDGQLPIVPGTLIVYKTQNGELAYRFDGQSTVTPKIIEPVPRVETAERSDKIPFQQNPNSPGYWTAIIGRPNLKAGSINLPNLFPVPDRVISRQHVEIIATPDGKRIIKDLSHQGGLRTEAHGTWVELEPVAGQKRWKKLEAGESYELKPGQSFALGTVIQNVKLSYGNESRTYDFKDALIYTLGKDGNSLITHSEPYMSAPPSAAARAHVNAPVIQRSELPPAEFRTIPEAVLIQSTLFGKPSSEDLRLNQISNDMNSPTWVGVSEGDPPRLVSASPESSFKPLLRIVHRNDKYYVQLSSDLSSEVFSIDGVRRSMGQQVLLEGQIYNVRIGNHRLVLSLPRSAQNSHEASKPLEHVPILMKAPDIRVSNPRTMGAIFGGHENYGYGTFIPHDGNEVKLGNSSTVVRYNAKQQRYEYKVEGQNWQEWKKGEVISHSSIGPLILVESNVIPQKTDRSEQGIQNVFEHARYRLSQEGVQQHFEKIKEDGGELSSIDFLNASLFFTKNLDDAKQSYDSGNIIRTQGGIFGGTSIIFAAVDPATGKIYRFFSRDLSGSSQKNERWYVTADSQTGKLYWIEREGRRREPVDMSGIPQNAVAVPIELERMTGRLRFPDGQAFPGLAPLAAQRMKNLQGLVIEAGSALATSALRVSTGIE